MCDCKGPKKQYKNVPMWIGREERFRTWRETLDVIDKFIQTEHSKPECSSAKRPPGHGWLNEEADKKTKTDKAEKLRSEEDRIRALEQHIKSLEMKLASAIDAAEFRANSRAL